MITPCLGTCKISELTHITVDVEATWTHSGPGGGTQRLHHRYTRLGFKLNLAERVLAIL
jgi:hypothetical protein